MSNPKIYRVNLIQDMPALKDEFGAHARLTDALFELIDTHDGGISIGLEGGWGSGKSTVINLLKEKYEKEPNSLVILFDAWAHQGDPLRRTFLETIIKRLEKLGWVNDKTWEGKRAELAQRRRIAETRNIPRLGIIGILLALSVFLIPVGLAFLNAGLRQPTIQPTVQSTIQPTVQATLQATIQATLQPTAQATPQPTVQDPNSLSGMATLGILITLIPIGILSLSFLINSFNWVLAKRRGQSDLAEEIFDNFGALISQKHITDTKTETIENPNPTSVEFEEMFTNLMSEALGDQKHRLILAFDNLDRVMPSEALSILSVLQTFFRHSEHNQPAWFKKLYVLIPYDPRGLRKLWDTKDENKDKAVASAFLDKTFQLRFEVPPLLLSDLRSYLIHLLGQALPDHDATEFHSAYRVFMLYSNKNEISPTPRGLKIFVNQIGTINRQWGNKFPLAQVAYYVLLRNDSINIPKKLLERNLPESEFIDILGEGLHENFAAMAFNVDVRKASQLLLRSSLEASLGNADADKLKEQSAYPGFWEVLQDIHFKDWTEKESSKLANAAFCLASDNLFADVEPAIIEEVVRSLKKAASQVSVWTPLNLTTAQGLISLLRLISDATLAKTILQKLPPVPAREPSGNQAAAKLPWAEGLVHLLKGIKSQNLENVYADGINLDVGVDSYIELCGQIYREDPNSEFWSILNVPEIKDDVANALSDILSSNELAEDHINAIQVIKEAMPTLPWKKITTDMISGLKSGGVIQPSYVKLSLMALWRLRDMHPTINTEIENLTNHGHLLHHLHHIKSDQIAVAWCIFLLLQRNPTISLASNIGNSQDGYIFLTDELFINPKKHSKITQKFADLLAHLQHLDLLLTVLDTSEIAKSWIIECVKWVASQDYALDFFSPELIVTKWKFLKENLSKEVYDSLIGLMVNQSNILSYLCSLEFDLEQAGLYTFLVQKSDEKGSEFHIWCQKGLGDIGLSEWGEALKTHSSLAELIIDLSEKEIEISLGSAYEDAFLEHAKWLLSNESTSTYLSNCWETLLEQLKPPRRDLLRSRLLKVAERADGKIPSIFFNLYGKEIANAQTLNADRDVVLNLFLPLIRDRDEAGLKWLDLVFTEHPNILDGHNANEVNGFKDRLQEALEEEEVNPTISSIASHLGIHRNEVNQEDTAD